MSSRNPVNWKDWGQHVNYTCTQFLGTKDVFLENTPPNAETQTKKECIQWNAMIDSFLINSRVLASFFTMNFIPIGSKYTEPVKPRFGDYYMRRLDKNFTLTSEKYDLLRDWHTNVSKTVAHLGVDRTEMLCDRLSDGQEIIDILDSLISVAKSRLRQRSYIWNEGVVMTGHHG